MVPKDIVVQKLPFLQETEEVEDDNEMLSEDEHSIFGEDDFTDPSIKAGFFKNTSNNESQNKMLNFDETCKDDDIYEIMLKVLDNTTIDIEKENIDLKKEINTLFSKVINNYKCFTHIKCENLFGRVFLQFSECIDVDSNLVYSNLFPVYRNIIKRELIKIIGENTFKMYEKRCISQNKVNDINNHQNVTIQTI